MSIDPSQLEIQINREAQRFEINLGDTSAYVEYQISRKTIILTHTEVPVEYEGKGIAGRLARYALDYARAEGYRVYATCPFVSAYIERHPEYHSITRGY